MIFSKCNFFSKILKSHVDVNILLPVMSDNDCLFHSLNDIYNKRPMRTLYLLHGALEDNNSWMRHVGVEDLVEGRNLAVVMPAGQNSFYTNAKYGLNYFDFITLELPLMIEYLFPVSDKGQDRYIAGASMGGYGAAKCALSFPDRYKAFGVFSGALDPKRLEPRMKQEGFSFFQYDLIFGGVNEMSQNDNDLYTLAKRLDHSESWPDCFVACGYQDKNNYDMNLEFYQLMAGMGGKAYFYAETGQHDWCYWERCLKEFLMFIP